MGYLHIEHDPSTHMVATLDSSLDLSLFDDAHWPFASFLVSDLKRDISVVNSLKGSIVK